MTTSQISTALSEPDIEPLTVDQIQYFTNNFTIVASSSEARFGFSSGLDAVVLKDNTSGKLLISIAGVGPTEIVGTGELFDTGVESFASGFNTPEFADLRTMTHDVLASNTTSVIDIFGHSQGGQLAQVLFSDSISYNWNQRVESVEAASTVRFVSLTNCDHLSGYLA